MKNPRKMRVLTSTWVTDLDTGKQVGAEPVPAGKDVDLVELKTDKNNVVWARSAWGKKNNKNWGLRFDRFGEVPPPEPTPDPIPEPPREPVPEPPIDVDPDEPGNGDVVISNGWLQTLFDLIKRLISLIPGVKLGGGNA